MKKQILTTIVAAALIAAAASTAMAQNVAIVNGKAIPVARLEALAKQAASAGRQMPPEQLREIVIAREIFAQEALARGLDASDSFKMQMEMNRQSILINELVADFQKSNPVTDADAKADYDKFASESPGKEYSAHHILVEKEDQAKAIIAQLKKGAKFDVIAKKSSKDPGSGKNGGALGWANAGSYVKEFSDALQALDKGKITETPVKSQFGYHVIRLDDVRDAQAKKLPPFEEVKAQIVEELTKQKIGKFQEELRAKAKIE